MLRRLIPIFLLIPVFYWSCAEKTTEKKLIIVKNPLNIKRALETVEINLEKFPLDSIADGLSNTFAIVDTETNKEVTSQVLDTDEDGTMDLLLFQPEIAANSERSYEIVASDAQPKIDSMPICYSRFVPERTDDYAWENNRVAFRTYGPKAQKMVEDNIKGGTLSSGIDAWLKRVEYPIINKWYEKELETDGSYHEDTGEGLDNFHVGKSRGVGGIAVKADSTYFISRNFLTWRTITTGPVRTSFELTYADWYADGTKITEKKHVSLDYGQNLSKFQVSIQNADTVSVGLTLHDKKGDVMLKQGEGWVSYWEPLEDSEIGLGIVAPEGTMLDAETYDTDKKDESNIYAHMKVVDGMVIYYAGFGWKKSGQFNSKTEWEDYLRDFAEKINNPMTVEIR